jgi:hypothetical protein
MILLLPRLPVQDVKAKIDASLFDAPAIEIVLLAAIELAQTA